MYYNSATDRYEPIAWSDAFALMGRKLRELPSPTRLRLHCRGG